MTRADIVAAARSQLEVGWMHQGRLADVALDCIGLLLVTALQVGVAEARMAINDPVLKSYDRSPEPVSLIATCDRYLDPITQGEMTLGDIPVFRFKRHPQHFAIISELKPLSMVHALRGTGRVAEHRIDDLWRSRIVRVYRFRGIDG